MGRMTSHPAVVIPYSSGYTSSGSPYLLMEYLEQGSLGDVIDRSGSTSWQQAVEWILPIAAALGHGHAQGIFHRDVKPHNILLAPDGSTKLADFGIAYIRESAATTQGTSFSLAHAPPETFADGNDRRDERSDLYSLASSLYELIDGNPPFHRADVGDSQLAYIVRIADHPVPTLTSAPAPIGRFIVRALAKDPAARPATAADFISELEQARAQSLLPPSPQAQPAVFTPPTPANWSAATPAPNPQREPAAQPATRRWLLAAAAGLALVGAAVPAVLLTRDGSPDVATQNEVADAPADTAPPTAEPAQDEQPPQEPAAARSATDPIVFDDHESAISSMAVLEDGRLVTASWDNTARVWDPANPDDEPVVFTDHSAGLHSVIALADGHVATASSDRTVRVWDPTNPEVDPIVFAGHQDSVSVLAELDDGRIASAGQDRTVRIWDPGFANGDPIVLSGHSKDIGLLVPLADGRLASADHGGDVLIWDLADPAAEPVVRSGHDDSVWALIELDDGRIATASSDETVQIWDPANPEAAPVVFSGHDAGIHDMAMLADGRLASASLDGTMQIWSVDDVSNPIVFDHGTQLGLVDVLDDGRIATAISWDGGTIRLWPSDDPTSTPAVYDGHNSNIEGLAVLADGWIATASQDGTVQIWNPAVLPGG